MNSKTIYDKVESFYKWLKDQKLTSDAVLPKSFSWINLGDAVGSQIPSRPGFYVVRLSKPPQDNSDIVYIGESNDIERRIGFLRGAIRRGTAPHLGGKTLRSIFGATLSQFEISWLVTPNVYAAKLFERYLILSFYEEYHQPLWLIRSKPYRSVSTHACINPKLADYCKIEPICRLI